LFLFKFYFKTFFSSENTVNLRGCVKKIVIERLNFSMTIFMSGNCSLTLAGNDAVYNDFLGSFEECVVIALIYGNGRVNRKL